MRSPDLAQDYIWRADIGLRALDVLFDARSWADVVRESQEIVELTLEALLRASGIDPPRVHDLSGVLLSERARASARRAVELVKPHVPLPIDDPASDERHEEK